MNKKVLLTGSTGYIGRRLLPLLLSKGYDLICPVRDPSRFDFEDFTKDELKRIEIIQADLSNKKDYAKLSTNIDYAYFLVHSLKQTEGEFESLEEKIARYFKDYLENSTVKQVIYLSGIVNDEKLSSHLRSRLKVEEILMDSKVNCTVLRAGIIIGSGSASFEIIRDLVEKLPIMIAPRWVNSKCQPIGIKTALEYLSGIIGIEQSYNRHFDIGGKDVFSYKEMLLQFARIRKLKRYIITVPVLTPKLSSKWLYFVTSTSYQLAANLVDSLKNDAVCTETGIDEVIQVEKTTYKEMLERTFQKVKYGDIISSWKDSVQDHHFNEVFMNRIEAPDHGVFKDVQKIEFNEPLEKVINNIWKIGGDTGWYYMNFLWQIRGFLDLMVGGVGLRRGRRSPIDLKKGDALDFWRVLNADKEKMHLLLYAEMKLPGEAWLEFKIKESNKGHILMQKATFRPKGLFGRLYWYSVFPFHLFIFRGMAEKIVRS